MSLRLGVEVALVRAVLVAGYRLRLSFSDGHETVIDFGPFLRQAANSQTRQFLKRDRFAAFAVLHGNLVWGDYDLCFPIEALYDGRIDGKIETGSEMAMAETPADYETGKKRTSSANV